MGSWIELPDAYGVDRRKGIKGTKGFRWSIDREDGLADANLPVEDVTPFVDARGNTLDQCICIGSTERRSQRDAQAVHLDRIFHFETPGLSDGEDGNQSEAAEARDLQFYGGAEIESVPDGSAAFAWYDDGDLGEDVETQIEFRVSTGSFIRPAYRIEEINVDNYITNTLIPKLGNINDSEQLGFRTGSLMFKTFRGPMYYDGSDDDQKYYVRFDHEFEWRIIADPDVVNNDFRYYLDPKTGTWKRVLRKNDNQEFPPSTDLSGLIAWPPTP